MSASRSRPVTRSQILLMTGYLLYALARQVAHDVRNIYRWAR